MNTTNSPRHSPPASVVMGRYPIVPAPSGAKQNDLPELAGLANIRVARTLFHVRARSFFFEEMV